jgi:HD-GYP domain-containing protein (c-di-GMP phosphodiesterase class II)
MVLMPLETSVPRKRIDYQRALRDFAKSMVHLRRPERLLKMITRFIDRDFELTHTSLLIHDEAKKRFVFATSRGSRKVPLGLVRVESDNPLVIWFRDEKTDRRNHDYLDRAMMKAYLKEEKIGALFGQVKKTMEHLNVELAVPGYYKRNLQTLFLFGRKKNKRSFTASEVNFFQVLAQDCSMAVKTAEYHRSLLRQNLELNQKIEEIEKFRQKERETFYEIMRSLVQEIYAKDPHTFGHISQVEQMGLMTARELGLELGARRQDVLSASLILHDVGKIGIPDSILQKPSALTSEEWAVMKTHAAKGASILSHLTDFREIADIVRAHHENYDGSGYPQRLRGEQIPIESRIVSVVDAFHAMISIRVYRPSQSIEYAFAELKRCSGTQFDPKVVDAFIRGLTKEIKKDGEKAVLASLLQGSVQVQPSAG